VQLFSLFGNNWENAFNIKGLSLVFRLLGECAEFCIGDSPMSQSSKKTYVAAVIFVAIAFLFTAASAFADSYAINVIKTTQSEGFYGIDSAGDFVVNVSDNLMTANSMSCGGVSGASSCFETYYVGQQNPTFSTAAPDLVWDNGSKCIQSVAGGTIGGMCNNGYDILSGYIGAQRAIWTGTDPLSDYLMNGTLDGALINSNGDAVFINASNDTLVSVTNLSCDPAPVPEPESFILFGTGCAALFGIARRRYSK
jgi:hypothetical protein